MSSPISSIYRIWFLRIDPVLTCIGIYTNIFTPEFILAGLDPSYRSPPGSETVLLLDTCTGWFFAVLILQLFLLRARQDDVLVWKSFAAAIGVVDTVICAAILRALNAQGRLAWEAWRAEEIGNFGITAACALVRWALVLGLGVKEGKGKAS